MFLMDFPPSFLLKVFKKVKNIILIKSFNYTITEDEHKLDANYIIPEDAKIEIKSLYFPA